MENLHLFNNEKFTNPFIEFINHYYDSSEHLFLVNVGREKGIKIASQKNVKKISRNFKSLFILIKSMYLCKKIYVHSLFNKKVVYLLWLQPWLLTKCNWIVWGGDLYFYRKRDRSLRSNFYEFVRRRVIKQFYEISTLVYGDYELAKKWYNTKAQYCKAIYMNMDQNDYLLKLFNRKKKTKKSINILIGNSADPSNNHKEVFDLLTRFKNEDIKIYCPLSYGVKEYANEIIDYGKKIFGDKFKPLEEFMDIYQYLDLLGEVDVGVFNNDRQQALGNILPLLYLGKKVYMRSGTTMWDEFSSDLKLFDIKDIENEKFNSFKYIDEQFIQLNRKKLEPRFNNKLIKKIWDDIFYRKDDSKAN